MNGSLLARRLILKGLGRVAVSENRVRQDRSVSGCLSVSSQAWRRVSCCLTLYRVGVLVLRFNDHGWGMNLLPGSVNDVKNMVTSKFPENMNDKNLVT